MNGHEPTIHDSNDSAAAAISDGLPGVVQYQAGFYFVSDFHLLINIDSGPKAILQASRELLYLL